MAIIHLPQIEQQELLPGFHVRFVHSENTTTAFWEVEAGSVLPEHAHVHEQIAQVTEGEFVLTIAGETTIMLPGMVAVIPSNVPHSGKALTPCKMVDTFYPVREEYR